MCDQWCLSDPRRYPSDSFIYTRKTFARIFFTTNAFSFPSPALASNSLAKRNCSDHPWSRIYYVTLLVSSGLFIMASKERLLAFLDTSTLPLVLRGQVITTCLALYDGYPHW